MNLVLISGIVSKKETRHTGRAELCEFTIRVDRPKGGEDQIEVTAWEGEGQKVAHADQGARVVVQGRLRLDTWEWQGRQCSKLRVQASSVEVIAVGAYKPAQPDDDGPPPPDDLPF